MKYLKTFESHIDNELINNINDICLELTDMGFYSSDEGGRKLNSVSILPAHGFFKDKASLIIINHNNEFHFNEIKDCIYRIKDIVGIKNIGTFNYELKGDNECTRCNMNDLENEKLNLGILKGAFITFNFSII